MKKQTPAPKRASAPKKMATDNGIGIKLAVNEMADRKLQKGKAEMEAKSMVKKSTSKDYALTPGSTDPFKRQDKKGNLVPTKMAKEMAKKKKK